MEPQMQPEPQIQPEPQPIQQPIQQSISQPVDSIPDAVAVRESQIPSGSIPDAVLALNQENEDGQLSPNEKEDIRVLSIKFEKIINNIHDKFMAIGRVDSRDYKRLSAILENLSVSYGRYLTPNSEFMINSMKRKLDELSPLPNLQNQGEKFIKYLKSALQNFYTKSIAFSKFEKNSFELNEQFNTVLSQLIDKLKHGKHEETIILIRLLRGYIDEIMTRHSITKKEITKNVFIERLNNMISKPIEIVRKVVRPAPKITEATYTSLSSESGSQPQSQPKSQQRPQTRMTTKTKDVNLPSLLDAGKSKRAVEIATKEKKEAEDKLIQSRQKTRELELRISRMEERAKSKQRSSSSSKSSTSKPVPAVLPTYQAPLATQNQRQEPVRNLGQESVPVRRPESEQVPVRNPGQVPETEPRPVPMRRSRQKPLSYYPEDPLTKEELWTFIYYASQIKNKN
jgi:hypothetical protein